MCTEMQLIQMRMQSYPVGTLSYKRLIWLTDRHGDRGEGRRRRGRHQQDLADAPPLRVLGKTPGNGQVYSRSITVGDA